MVRLLFLAIMFAGVALTAKAITQAWGADDQVALEATSMVPGIGIAVDFIQQR